MQSGGTSTVVLNGQKMEIQGSNISVKNGRIFADGIEQVFKDTNSTSTGKKILEIYVHGDVEHVTSDRSITVNGTVQGNVRAQGIVTCGDVEDYVHAGGSVYCDNVSGDIEAGGSVTCDQVFGDVQSGGSTITDD